MTRLVPFLLAMSLAGVSAQAEEGEHQRGHRGGFDFAAFDADGDGLITRAEAEARAETLAGDRIAEVDADGNGEITAAEIEASILAKAADRAAEMAERMIERRDRNRDGVLSGEELAAGDRLDRMFSRLDRDDDGAISREEFAQAQARVGRHQGPGPRRHN
ncbi:MAG: EF-hand domain-containing protein [Rhodobacteraceae bacterium]|nr:EF-hand domain-containing protein [Paracoccaceae bacterium]